MRILNQKRCIIGEGPVWNDVEQRLYFTNGTGSEICMLDMASGKLTVLPVKVNCAAFCFDCENRLIVSRADGVFILGDDERTIPLYDTSRYEILYANDMKVGPDGRIYVGTQSRKRQKISDDIDGKLYSISPDGTVRVLLDGLLLSNGLEWSMDETKFYHTDSDTKILREYDFDKETGDIRATGRSINIPGVDGFTIDRSGTILAACWGQRHIALVDSRTLEVTGYIDTPCRIPASCGFAGPELDILAITTASLNVNLEQDPNAGFTCLVRRDIGGRTPWRFGCST